MPGAHGISVRHWKNILSNLRRAIQLSGLSMSADCKTVPLTDEWAAAALKAPDKAGQCVLRRLGRYCSARQIRPAEVTDEVVASYLAHIDRTQLTKWPQQTVNAMLLVWNRHVANDPVSGLRPLTKPNRSRQYALAWNALPPALAEEAAEFRRRSLEADPFGEDEHRAVRPATAGQRDRMLRRLATAVLLNSGSEGQINSLADLVRPATLKIGLRYLLSRAGAKPSRQAFHMAHLAFVIARDWAKLPDSDLAEIKHIIRKLERPKTGLTEKNKRVLSQFRDKSVLQKLLALPEQLVRESERRPLDTRSARLVQVAIAIAILFTTAIRIGNLVSIDRARHFRPTFSTHEAGMLLCFGPAEVKNDVPLEKIIPAEIMAIIDLYMAKYQPRLTDAQRSTLLFPARVARAKHHCSLRKQIIDALFERLGIRLNPHAFRHLCALLFLEAHPGHFEEVRRLLGHKSVQTSIDFYTGTEATSANRRYHEILARTMKPKKVA
jgi:integrase